jgi:uncharacterized protein Yka (UPF0111/DUF47 family)
MVFPVESEDRTTRNLLMICQDHARLVVEIFRRVLVMIDSLVKDETGSLRERLNEVEKLHKDSLGVRRSMMKELHETGGILVNREDFYRLINKSAELMDYSNEIGFRIWEIGAKKWRLPERVKRGLLEVSKAAFDTLTKLRESLLSLGFNSQRAALLAREVDEEEHRVDTLYRELDLEIITSKAELPLILILRDIAMHIEDMIDAAKDEADLIEILAL